MEATSIEVLKMQVQNQVNTIGRVKSRGFEYIQVQAHQIFFKWFFK